MFALGHKQTQRLQLVMSAFAPKADIPAEHLKNVTVRHCLTLSQVANNKGIDLSRARGIRK
jgi:hypothetical protein